MRSHLVPSVYPIEAFPKVVREAILETERNYKAPRSLIATSFLAAMSATAQAQVKVKHPISGQSKPAALFLFVIANSGERKSTVDRLVCQPLHTFDAMREAVHTEAMQSFSSHHLRWQSVHRELVKRLTKATCNGDITTDLARQLNVHEQLKPIKPRLRRLILQDTSERALLDTLQGESESIAIMSDEGEIILRSPFLTKHGVMNKTWDSGVLQLSRANGISYSARDSRVTMSIMAQESVFEEFCHKQKNASRGTGFFSRFLMAMPESTQGFRLLSDSELSHDWLYEFHALISDLLPDVKNDLDPQNLPQLIYELDDDAKEYFIRIVNWIESQIRPMGSMHDINDSASKFGENVLRVAALIEYFSAPYRKISRDTINRAYDIVYFHICEFKRIFSTEYELPQEVKDTNALCKYLEEKLWNQGICWIRKNVVLNGGPVRKSCRFEVALSVLQQRGIITVARIDNSKTMYIVLNTGYFSSLTSPSTAWTSG